MSLLLCHEDHGAGVHEAGWLRAASPSSASLALGKGLGCILSTHHLPDLELPFPSPPSLFAQCSSAHGFPLWCH